MSAMLAQHARPLEAIGGFAALLREHGMKVGIAEQIAFVRAALLLPGGRAQQLSSAWRAIACRDRRDWRQWPELFERYWQPERVKGKVSVSGRTRPSRDLRQAVRALHDALSGGPGGSGSLDSALDVPEGGADEVASQPRAQGGASRTEALHDRSMAMWMPQDLTQLEQLAARMAERLRKRLTRRWQDAPAGRRLDLRRTLRRSLATGGVPIQPAWRRPRRERPRLFILVDVSRSMQTHAQLFLRIARAFVGTADARVFVFHTRLIEITPLLQRDSGTVQEKVNAVTAGFGGGTRIATSLADFQRSHARAQLGRGARVWLLSDGFDADEPDQLPEQMRLLRRRGARITWFHPTAAAPASAAVQGCAGLIESFVPLSSLRDLARAEALIH
ncbi:VWA domain-containing protein [Paucibacter sp. R3-3]|uniref:VWA domain-containing protein n=1 Tax=Roseateles agri TaxID=3098619 RepID=A0ABU5DMA9_9BURK|nr:VWA domain-containing protein [Paucibacter sp. R3-3]MDY0747279.1 VWA domain-containing protein [Paucibacter sp. R3-3]